ncbi:hypothetical protein B1R27_27195 [Streptomyces sp. GKU 895]|nr:hypothetical protein B1R27_27195 [Streptomyces sp. GKU 895]
MTAYQVSRGVWCGRLGRALAEPRTAAEVVGVLVRGFQGGAQPAGQARRFGAGRSAGMSPESVLWCLGALRAADQCRAAAERRGVVNSLAPVAG